MVKDVIKKNYIFNNITLASRPHIIKVSFKLDIAIIWVDIWNVQSGSKVKELINRYFNVGSFITTIKNTNINCHKLYSACISTTSRLIFTN